MDDRQLIADLLSALEYHTEQTRPIEFSKVAIEAAREYLRKPAQRPWVNMTEDEVDQGLLRTGYAMKTAEAWRHGVEWAQFNLMKKNMP